MKKSHTKKLVLAHSYLNQNFDLPRFIKKMCITLNSLKIKRIKRYHIKGIGSPLLISINIVIFLP